MPSPMLQCSSYWKGSLQVNLDYSRQLYLLQHYNKNIILIEYRAFVLVRKRFFKVKSLSGLFKIVKMEDILSFLRETVLYQKIWWIEII